MQAYLPFMEFRQKKGDKAHLLKRICLRVKCFVGNFVAFMNMFLISGYQRMCIFFPNFLFHQYPLAYAVMVAETDAGFNPTPSKVRNLMSIRQTSMLRSMHPQFAIAWLHISAMAILGVNCYLLHALFLKLLRSVSIVFCSDSTSSMYVLSLLTSICVNYFSSDGSVQSYWLLLWPKTH